MSVTFRLVADDPRLLQWADGPTTTIPRHEMGGETSSSSSTTTTTTKAKNILGHEMERHYHQRHKHQYPEKCKIELKH